MADARKRKLDELEKRLDEVEQTQERQGKTTVNLQRRIDRLDKSSTLVLERADEVEDLYKAAEQSRDFKNLARDTSAAVLKSIGAQLGLPAPLPELTPTEWQAISAETRAIPQTLSNSSLQTKLEVRKTKQHNSGSARRDTLC